MSVWRWHLVQVQFVGHPTNWLLPPNFANAAKKKLLRGPSDSLGFVGLLALPRIVCWRSWSLRSSNSPRFLVSPQALPLGCWWEAVGESESVFLGSLSELHDEFMVMSPCSFWRVSFFPMLDVWNNPVFETTTNTSDPPTYHYISWLLLKRCAGLHQLWQKLPEKVPRRLKHRLGYTQWGLTLLMLITAAGLSENRGGQQGIFVPLVARWWEKCFEKALWAEPVGWRWDIFIKNGCAW